MSRTLMEKEKADNIQEQMGNVNRNENCKKERKHLIYREKKIRITQDISSETMQARRQCNEIFKALKGQLRILYPATLSFKIEGKTLSQTKMEGLYHYQAYFQEMLKVFREKENDIDQKVKSTLKEDQRRNKRR